MQQEEVIQAFYKIMEPKESVRIVSVDPFTQFVRDVTLVVVEVPNELLERGLTSPRGYTNGT